MTSVDSGRYGTQYGICSETQNRFRANQMVYLYGSDKRSVDTRIKYKSPKSHLGRAELRRHPSAITAENGLTRCVCYYLCNAHCRRVQHSAAGICYTSTPQCPMLSTGLRYIALSDPLPQINCPCPLGLPTPPEKKSSRPT